MGKNYRNFAVLLVVGVILLLQACQKDGKFSPSLKTFYSPTVPVGNGVASAWISQNIDGEPVAVGVNLSEKALENLPSEPSEYVLLLPKNKGKNFYTLVQINWNPQGHEPAHVYDLPHFDVHFYIIPNEERMAIGPNDLAQFANAPASQYIPDHYLQIPGGVPQMGAHWADLLSPEFNGGVFTKTYIWGTYDGKVTFWEAMITNDYLLSHPNDLITLRQPVAYQRDGYYATQYKVSYSDSPKGYTVALTNLVYHVGE